MLMLVVVTIRAITAYSKGRRPQSIQVFQFGSESINFRVEIDDWKGERRGIGKGNKKKEGSTKGEALK